MESCRVIHVSFGAYGTACAENWRPVGRMDITVQFHPPNCRSSNSWARALLYNLLQYLHSRFPVQVGQQVDDINHHIQGTFFQALLWSVEATCMLDRGLTSSG